MQAIFWFYLKADIIHNGIPDSVSAVVNLTGAPIMVPFTYFGNKYKGDIWMSRVGSTMLLADIISYTQCKPNVFISVTSTGITDRNVLISTTWVYLLNLLHR